MHEKHKKTGTDLYKVWYQMRYRCTKPKHFNFAGYGGRGIRVCASWNESFLAFEKWALKHGYEKGLELDRINNDGNYNPRNCRWTTHSVNQSNKRKYNTSNKIKHIYEKYTDKGLVRYFITYRQKYIGYSDNLKKAKMMLNNYLKGVK